MPETSPDMPLSPYRVLDLTDERGYLCGRLLADLGADVIKVEPPGGDPGRRLGPFYEDRPHPERSLFWFAYNLNKRSITLNLGCADGRALFLRLAGRANVVVESFPPGTMEGLGLGYEALAQVNPGIILTSITPFGQTGPYAHFQAPDIVGQAMGGLMAIAGDPDRPPVRISFPQAYLQASAEAAVGTLLALYHFALTGEGQRVDVSMQQSVVWSLMNATVTWDLNRENLRRAGALRRRATTGTVFRCNWPCKGGFVTFYIYGGAIGAPSLEALVGWMDEEGAAPDYLKVMDFYQLDPFDMPQEEADLISQPVADFFKGHTVEELYREAIRRRILLYPVSTVRDLLRNEQLRERGYFQEVAHPELGRGIVYPGPFARLRETPIRFRRPPPRIGEHNREIYQGEMGLSAGELRTLREAGVI